jgi:parallel beta-helix repeat protein
MKTGQPSTPFVRRLALVLAPALALVLLWLLVSVVHADPDTIYVSTTGTDDPSCGTVGSPCRTIPHAVDNRAQAGDVVVVAAGTYTEAFSLKAGVVISGAGAGVTIVDGENARGPLVTADDGGIGGSTVLRGLTIRRGFTDTVGSGVYVDNGAAPAIEDCVIRENVSSVGGGGLSILFASPALSNVQVLSNAAGWSGGGLFILDGSPVLNGVQVLSNTADQDGGGVYVCGDGSPIFIGGQVAGNRVITGSGGGIFVDGGSSPAISGTQVVSNAAGWGGGGIYLQDSQAVLTNVQVLSNTAQDGAGIQVWPVSAPTITGGEVRGNVASDGGGGIHVAGDSSPFIDGVMVRDNQALGVAYGGGGIYVTGDASPVIHGGQVLSNAAAGSGGGIYVYAGATAAVSGTHVISNVAGDGFGGGVAVDYEASAVMTDVHVLSNTAAWDGGGVFVNQDSTLTFVGGRVQGNEAAGDGGGFDVTFDSTALLEGVQVLGNRDSGWVGGIYLHYLVTATVRNCTVADNTNYGIRVEDAGVVTITQSTVYSNAVGGIYLASSTLVEHTLVYSHISSFPRCGICVTDGSPTLADVTSRHNYHGVYVNGSNAHPTIRNSHLLSNTLGLYLQQGNATLGDAPGQGNNVYGNGYGVFNSVPHVTCIAASYNYWGAAGGPDDDSEDADACYPSGNTNDNDGGDDVTNGVRYDPWVDDLIGDQRRIYLPLVVRNDTS